MRRALPLVLALAACGPSRTRPIDDAGPLPDGGSTGLLIDELPKGFPRPFVPADQPITPERVELGRHLFYDPRLSRNGEQSCASCHDQARGFAEARETSVGSTGEAHFRNAPGLANVGYRPVFGWADPVTDALHEQALIPLFGEMPVELGNLGHEDALLARLGEEPRYVTLFAAAFPDDAAPITLHHLVVALAAFQRNLLSYRSPYDRYVYGGDEDALSASAERGLELFFGEDMECFHCHGGFDFSDSTRTAANETVETPFHNTGLYNVDGFGSYPEVDRGVMRVTGAGADMGRFRAPSLRNVMLTAPYFHDGSAATLDEVFDHYARGGRRILRGPNAGDGRESPFRDELVKGFVLTERDRADLRAFLEALTDEALLSDPRLADPWPAR